MAEAEQRLCVGSKDTSGQTGICTNGEAWGPCMSLVVGGGGRLVQRKLGAKTRRKARSWRAVVSLWCLFVRCWSSVKTEGDVSCPTATLRARTAGCFASGSGEPLQWRAEEGTLSLIQGAHSDGAQSLWESSSGGICRAGAGGWLRGQRESSFRARWAQGGREAASYGGLQQRRGLPLWDQVSHTTAKVELFNQSRLAAWAAVGS